MKYPDKCVVETQPDFTILPYVFFHWKFKRCTGMFQINKFNFRLAVHWKLRNKWMISLSQFHYDGCWFGPPSSRVDVCIVLIITGIRYCDFISKIFLEVEDVDHSCTGLEIDGIHKDICLLYNEVR